ncbi:MAG: hypothetical protein ACLU4N_09335 [Butyricimonas faecihominis]
MRLNVGGVVSSGAKLLNMVNSPASYEIITSNRTGETPQTVYSDLYRNHLNVSKDMVNRWTEEKGTGVKYPRIIDFMGERLLLDQYNVHSQEITGAYLENVSFENKEYFVILRSTTTYREIFGIEYGRVLFYHE